MLLALIFGAVFAMIIGALTGYAVLRDRGANVRALSESARAIAEAGVEVYGAHLAASGAPSAEEHYAVPVGQAGTATVTAAPSISCDEVASVLVNSVAATATGGGSARVSARYALPTVAATATLTHASAPEDVSVDFDSLKARAQAQSTYFSYGAPSDTASGVHLVFNDDGTVTVYHVLTASGPAVTAYADGESTADDTMINSEIEIGNYAIPHDCGLIFVENRAWIEGTVKGKVTVAVANTGAGAADAIIRGPVTYSDFDGGDGITVIAQRDVLIAADAPSTLALQGAYLALAGVAGRNLYDCASSYEPQNTLTITGSVFSYHPTAFSWPSHCGGAGYGTVHITPDYFLAADPPPFTPALGTGFSRALWHAY